jgi:predicted nucleic acid-binding protein
MLEEIPARSRFFIDSNIFIYHFLDLSEDCSNLLERPEGAGDRRPMPSASKFLSH